MSERSQIEQNEAKLSLNAEIVQKGTLICLKMSPCLG